MRCSLRAVLRRAEAMIRDWVERVLAVFLKAPLILLSTALFGGVSLVGSFADPTGRFQHGCARAWSRLVLILAGVRLEVDGLQDFRPSGPCVLCPNHQSDMDIPVLLAALPFQFRFAAKKSLFGVPFLGWHLRRAGHVSIDREHPRAALKALDGSVDWVRAGLPLVVFPEGRISQDGEVASFKKGAFLLARRTGAVLVPITIQGTREILRPSSWIVHAGPVGVTVGREVSSHALSLSELSLTVRERVLAQVSEGSGSAT